jgi:hypothetical protein
MQLTMDEAPLLAGYLGGAVVTLLRAGEPLQFRATDSLTVAVR